MGLFFTNFDGGTANIKTPSSISGTLVKSLQNSYTVATKIDSQRYKTLYQSTKPYYNIIDITENEVKKYQSEYVEQKWSNLEREYKYQLKVPIVIVQTMLANNNVIFIEFFEDKNIALKEKGEEKGEVQA